LVLLPRRAGEIAAYDALDLEHLGPAHEHAAPGQVGHTDVGEVAGVERHQVVGYQVGGDPEPEGADGGEHPALVGDGCGQHHVEDRDAVGRHEQQTVVTGVVDVAHLPRIERLRAQLTSSNASKTRPTFLSAWSSLKASSSTLVGTDTRSSVSSTSRSGRRCSHA